MGMQSALKPFRTATLSDAVVSAGLMRQLLSPRCASFLTVDPVGLLDIAADLGLHMCQAARDFARGEVPVTIMNRFEPAAIDGHDPALKHANPATEFDELRTCFRDRRAILAP